jgi:hypothetical protein
MDYNNNNRHALPFQPSLAQMGGGQGLSNPHTASAERPNPPARPEQMPPWLPGAPFYPTRPWVSTDRGVGNQVRYYGTGIDSTATDYVVGSEVSRTLQFDLPVAIMDVRGAATLAEDPIGGGITEFNMNLLWKLRIDRAQGDAIHTAARLASTVVGTSSRPGEVGLHGIRVDRGGALIVYFTPLVADLSIDITFACIEYRAPTNYTTQGVPFPWIR